MIMIIIYQRRCCYFLLFIGIAYEWSRLHASWNYSAVRYSVTFKNKKVSNADRPAR